MQIEKIPRNKHIGMASALIGFIVAITAPDTLTLAGGLFLLVMGAILWWMNR